MGLDAGESQWSLYWTERGRPSPCRLVPLLAGWADLDERESAADIEPGHPILIDPEFRIDPVLARFLGRSRFTWLAEGTREAYAKDYRLFFSFLWQREKYWHEADPDDLLDWESWRRRGQHAGRTSAAEAPAKTSDTGTYLDARPGFLLGGRPWLDRIAYSTRGPDSLGTLARTLQTTCYILIAYLTGMGDSEIKHLTRGCASPERDSNGTVYQWKINGLAFKGETSTRGVLATSGTYGGEH